MMLTQRDKDFIRYWEANRVRRKKTGVQFLIGIPVGLLFVIPIVINFSSGWYKRADMERNSANFNPAVLLIALLLILGFTAIFYQRHKWDQYEQHYQELLARQEREAGSAPAGEESQGATGGQESRFSAAEGEGTTDIPREGAGNSPKTE